MKRTSNTFYHPAPTNGTNSANLSGPFKAWPSGRSRPQGDLTYDLQYCCLWVGRTQTFHQRRCDGQVPRQCHRTKVGGQVTGSGIGIGFTREMGVGKFWRLEDRELCARFTCSDGNSDLDKEQSNTQLQAYLQRRPLD